MPSRSSDRDGSSRGACAPVWADSAQQANFDLTLACGVESTVLAPGHSEVLLPAPTAANQRFAAPQVAGD